MSTTAPQQSPRTLLERLDGPVPADAAGVVIVDLGALAGNWRILRDAVAPAACAAVVKANGYGLGADHVIPALCAAGANTFFVATLAEARQARALVADATVYVLDGVLPGSGQAIKDAGAIPVISSLPEAKEWAALAPSRNEPMACAFHVDSGLNRLGLSAREIRTLASDMHTMDRLRVRLVMSHLACADEPAHDKNVQQLDVFQTLQPLLPSAPLSIAASDGLMLGREYHLDLVRPGYALYGGQALPGRITPVNPVVEAYARVLQIRELAPGQSVGYSASFVADRITRVAVIAAGYGDGMPRHLSAATGQTAGHVAFGGRRAPIVGRVSMDLITVDISDLEDDVPNRGDWAELIGPSITLEDVGAACGTIGYEILTRLSPRFARVYLGGSGSAATRGA
ncbi:MAG: alanine racemase [Alphaproteobacteria bacterium BRH_c36]|nr:MAG: alanine racemase [Alphaproteobacteria bacterium BRH_c36]